MMKQLCFVSFVLHLAIASKPTNYVCLEDSLGKVQGLPEEYLCLGISPGSANPVNNTILQYKPHNSKYERTNDYKKTRFSFTNDTCGRITLREFPTLCLEHQNAHNSFLYFKTCNADEDYEMQLWDLPEYANSGKLRPAPMNGLASTLCIGPAHCSQQESSSTNDASDEIPWADQPNVYCQKSDANRVATTDPIRGSFAKLFNCQDVENSSASMDVVTLIDLPNVPLPLFEELPTVSPTKSPSTSPSVLPTTSPTRPTTSPSSNPTALPSTLPTKSPSVGPTQKPTEAQTTQKPSAMPTKKPTGAPTTEPTTGSGQRQATPAPTATEKSEARDQSIYGITFEDLTPSPWVWLPVILLVIMLGLSLMIGSIFVDSATIDANLITRGLREKTVAVFSAFDMFEAINIGYLAILAAQLNLPSIPQYLYNFSLMFSWTTLHLPAIHGPITDYSPGQPLHQRRLQETTTTTGSTILGGNSSLLTNGLERYTLSMGVAPEHLFARYLVTYVSGLFICAIGVLIYWAFLVSKWSCTKCCQTTASQDDELPRIETSVNANTPNARESRESAELPSLKSLSYRALLRAVYYSTYPTTLSASFQLYQMIKNDNYNGTTILLSSIAVFCLVGNLIWFITAIYKVDAIQTPSGKDSSNTSRSVNKAHGFLVRQWKPEFRQFWIVRMVFTALRALTVALLSNPRPIQPYIFVGLSILYSGALIVFRPYNSWRNNIMGVAFSLCHLPFYCMLVAFASDKTSDEESVPLEALGATYSGLLFAFILTTTMIVILKWLSVFYDAITEALCPKPESRLDDLESETVNIALGSEAGNKVQVPPSSSKPTNGSAKASAMAET